MTGQHESGVLSCPECTKHRERMFAWERKFWRLSGVLIECIGARDDQLVPGTSATWAEAYTKITGIAWREAVERAARFREQVEAERRRRRT